MSPSPEAVRPDVYDLLDDLLPVLMPGAVLDRAQDSVVRSRGVDRVRVSTATLVEECSGQPSTHWPRLVESWVRTIDRQLAEADAGIESVDQLRVQALPAGQADDGMTIAYNNAFELRLLADQSGSVRLVRRPDCERLGISPEEAVKVGLDRTISEVLVRLDVRTQELPGGSVARVASAELPFVSAGITSIPQLAGTELPHGALVAVPRHSMLVIQPMLTRRDLSTVAIVEGFAGAMYDGAPDPCTRQLYWFVDGQAYPLGTETGPDGRPTLTLSPQLGPIADRLPA